MSEHSPVQTTWNEFVSALYAPSDSYFDPFYWLYRLTYAFFELITPCRHRILARLSPFFRSVIPALGITVTLLCGGSYFSTFRHTVIRPRWCDDSSTNIVHSCQWEVVHALIVLFFMMNIIGQYLLCICLCPGFVPINQTNQMNFQKLSMRQQLAVMYHPLPHSTFCNKCDTDRPPRAHHCRICKRCILQMDHHCPWVNNCIGYNNYRSFVLLLFYVMSGCAYGSCILGRDFYEMMKQRIELYGWSIRGSVHGTGILDLPLPWDLWRQYQANGNIHQDILRAAFPLMFLTGLVICGFFGYHIKLIIQGLTTLEYVSRPGNIKVLNRSMRTSDQETTVFLMNPFDYGPLNNVKQIFGTSVIGLILPLPVRLPDPFQPLINTMINENSDKNSNKR